MMGSGIRSASSSNCRQSCPFCACTRRPDTTQVVSKPSNRFPQVESWLRSEASCIGGVAKAAPLKRFAAQHRCLRKLGPDQGRLQSVDGVPGGCGFEALVDVVDVFDALGRQPFAKRFRSLLGVDRNAIFPGGASAKHAVELYSRFGG